MVLANCSINTKDFLLHWIKAVLRSSFAFQAISILTFILGVPGNGLVLWMLGFRLPLTETTVFFLNLSLADFLYVLFVPLRVVYSNRLFDWPFGEFLCKMDFFVAFINMHASIFFLAMVSADRCLLVTMPVWYRKRRSKRFSYMACILVWLLSIVLCSPYLLFSSAQIMFNKTICFINYYPTVENTAYNWQEKTMVLVRFLIAFFIPIIMIISCYIIIGLRVRRMNLGNPARVYRIAIVTVLAFFINWTPYQIFSIISLFQNVKLNCSFHPSVFIGYPVVYAFAYINSCINPILYVYVGGGFTRKLLQSLVAVFEKAFNEDDLSERKGLSGGCH
ncbi:G-protein coupled receptor 1 [Microcaecilia unicolor]|uniref:Probable G-protein coupled receptor 152 n=1 Tax=Microcaecilia unicolor TaxID=1415580 RepID=A0A6P7X150_9AMPH|nr:probable G-protein coupled receptor 152 [Microcaecilia unicolor]XP_030046204.1 probable G-protein coupled receptor 152 [Microcaecilia unicolor]